MVVTVPAARTALLNEFPELLQYQRTATRLHPRPGAPDQRESSVGGPLLRPATEPWPACSQPHLVYHRELMTAEQVAARQALRLAAYEQHMRRLRSLTLAERASSLARFGWPSPPAEPEEPMYREVGGYEVLPEPLVPAPILQLFARDVPRLPFPDGTDLLQILWCPNTHDNHVPRALAFWRRAADIDDPLQHMPTPNRVEADSYVPRACVVHPEQVPEFPPICSLASPREHWQPLGKMPRELEERVRAWSDTQPEDGEYYQLAHAPGWTVGGWDMSSPDREILHTCGCGTDMRPLLTTDYDESLREWPPHGDPGFAWGDPRNWKDENPTGVKVTRSGILVILHCPADPTHPLRHVIIY